MSEESAKAFLERLKSDEVLRKEALESGSAEKLNEIITREGYEFTNAEWVALHKGSSADSKDGSDSILPSLVGGAVEGTLEVGVVILGAI
ncbi:MAG: Nif11-like leader peptide family natural product precursor, partial [Planctomycetota bacterium]|nr:Nif11-like leader peptide family natural product precursor [Planctomycetota bacterium]